MSKATALLLLVLFSPLFLLLFLVVKFTSPGPFLYKQKRMGKDRKTFTMYKIRTMIDGAEKMKDSLLKRNEADGPAFKIRNDPRYTKIGKFISHTALDELPQLFNILRGEMAFVGPRPLPVDEALQVPKKYQKRFNVLPGMTSPWILKGAHALSFEGWMKLDLDYVEKKSFWQDLGIFITTVVLVARLIFFSTGSSRKK